MYSIEFFRTERQRPLDADGFELPPWLNPYFAIPGFEPSDSDREWAVANLDADQDEAWAEYREWAEHVDRLEAISRRQLSDEDLQSAGLAVGYYPGMKVAQE
jgi:hypothetical protein